MPLLVAALLLSTPASALRAQTRVSVGDVIRVWHGGRTASLGTLTRVTAEQWTLSTRAGELTVAPSDVVTIELRIRHGNAWLGALVGGGVGLSLAALANLGGLCEESVGSEPCTAVAEDSPTSLYLALPLLGGAAGALLGAFIRSQRWVPGYVPDVRPVGPSLGLTWSIPIR